MPDYDSVEDAFGAFYSDYYDTEIKQLAEKYPREERSLYVDWGDLYRFDHALAEDLLGNPTPVIRGAKRALQQYELPVDVDDDFDRAHVRFHGLPEGESPEIREIRDRWTGRLVRINGVVRKATSVRPQLERASFICLRCGVETEVPQADDSFQEPHECGGCDRQGPFRLNFSQSEFVDYQRVRIQENPEGLRGGETPQSIDVDLEDDVCGRVTPGDQVATTGVLELEQATNDSKVFDFYIDGSDIEIEDEQFEDMDITAEDEAEIERLATSDDIYEQIVGSIAPSIYGYDREKLAIALQLFSGVTKRLEDGSRIRGDMHVLLVGDPGTAKSQLLSYVQNIAPRSVYTSGKGSSSAGITAAAVKDDFSDGDQWSLEAGALVLADRGIAAIDELDKMTDSDRSALHQALEQQEISISKAGINATLKSRCSLLAAANPKYGRFDDYEPVAEQIELEPALISRFDLIFTVTDKPDAERDSELAEHILATNYAGEVGQRVEHLATDETDEYTGHASPAIEPEMIRKYVAYAKQTCYPKMTDEAQQRIHDFYVDLRSEGMSEDAPVPVTARQLEAIVRLAEASARIRLAEAVEISDAERAIELVAACLSEVGVDPDTGEFDADFVEAGTSKSQRDRIRTLKALIEDVEEEYDEGAPLDIVYERVDEVGMDRQKAEDEITKLKQTGEVYEPKVDHVQTT